MPLSPSETRKLLRSIEHNPIKKLGQNFLIDGNIVKKSIQMAGLKPAELVLEIGPGLGTLTKELLESSQHVYAVEIDPRLFGHLQSKLQKWIELKKFFPLHGDAVKFPLGSIPQNCTDFKIVANLPYAISSPWIEAVLATGKIPKSMTLMLQKEASDRMYAEHNSKNYNALCIFLHGAFSLKQIHPVPRQCFYPTPRVDSVLVQMNRIKNPFLFSNQARTTIRRIFTQRRKQIGSLAKRLAPTDQNKVLNWLEKSELSTTLRPEQIDPLAWRELAKLYRN